MEDPSRRLWGDLNAQARYGELVSALGRPEDEEEANLFVMLARLLSNQEVRVLIHLTRRG